MRTFGPSSKTSVPATGLETWPRALCFAVSAVIIWFAHVRQFAAGVNGKRFKRCSAACTARCAEIVRFVGAKKNGSAKHRFGTERNGLGGEFGAKLSMDLLSFKGAREHSSSPCIRTQATPDFKDRRYFGPGIPNKCLLLAIS